MFPETAPRWAALGTVAHGTQYSQAMTSEKYTLRPGEVEVFM
jgi:hypothetical protein